jgi:hypothetical protein
MSYAFIEFVQRPRLAGDISTKIIGSYEDNQNQYVGRECSNA